MWFKTSGSFLCGKENMLRNHFGAKSMGRCCLATNKYLLLYSAEQIFIFLTKKEFKSWCELSL